MKTLYIHIGTPKTGTTSLQNFLEDNQAELLRHGIYYPLNLGHYIPLEREECVPSGNFYPVYEHILSFDTLTEKTQQDLRNTFSVADTVLLSTEELWGKGVVPDFSVFYKNLKEGLPEAAIKVIVYLRPQIDWLEAVHKQGIQAWKQANTLQDVYYDSDGYKSLLHYYDRLCEIGGEIGFENIIVRIYDKAEFQGGNIFSDFLSIFGLVLTDSYRYSYASNPTLSNDFIECIRRVNLTESISLEEYRNVFYYWATKEGISKLKADGCPPRLSSYTTEQRQSYMDYFRDENRKLAQRFLHRDTLFRQEFYGESGGKAVDESEVLTAAIRIFTSTIVELNRRCDRQQQEIDILTKRCDGQQKALKRLVKLLDRLLQTNAR